jgi:hypothetical protein
MDRDLLYQIAIIFFILISMMVGSMRTIIISIKRDKFRVHLLILINIRLIINKMNLKMMNRVKIILMIVIINLMINMKIIMKIKMILIIIMIKSYTIKMIKLIKLFMFKNQPSIIIIHNHTKIIIHK